MTINPTAESITLALTRQQLQSLKWLLVEESQRLDDDGRDGAFAASPLNAV
jgi:hypothetical protein